MKKRFALFFVLFAFSGTAQDLYSSDNVNLGPRNDFVQHCLTNMAGTNENLNATALCDCMADNLVPSLSKEQVDYYFRDNHLTEMFDNKETSDIMLNCISGSMNRVESNEEQPTEEIVIIEESEVPPQPLDIIIEEEIIEEETVETRPIYIYTKDGRLLGKRENLIEACAEGVKDRFASGEMKASSWEYCACFVDEIYPRLTAGEIDAMLEKNDMSFMLEEENLKIAMKCVKQNIIYSDDLVMTATDENFEFQYDMGVKSCEMEAKRTLAEKGVYRSDEEINAYCRCFADGVIEAGYTFGEITELQGSGRFDSRIMDELVYPCMQQAFYGADPRFSDKSLEGSNEMEEILLEENSGHYSLTIQIGTYEEMFVVDTTIAYIIFNKETELALKTSGTLTDDSYIGKDYFESVSGDMVLCDIVLLKEVNLGGYKIYDVPAAIVEGRELSFGTGILHNFSSWNIDEESNTLILAK